LDAGRIGSPSGIAVGLLTTAAGLALAVLPGVAGVLTAAVAIGVGTGVITPLAFAWLAGATPAERLGQTMGAAELGRELGDAGGPLIVATAAVATTLTGGFAVLAVLVAAAAPVVVRRDGRAAADGRASE
jgi:MFS family permease